MVKEDCSCSRFKVLAKLIGGNDVVVALGVVAVVEDLACVNRSILNISPERFCVVEVVVIISFCFHNLFENPSRNRSRKAPV